jgi:methylglutaconyl-CoA hydratase
MGFSALILDRSGPIASITLNRPDVHNAFDETLIAELTEGFTVLSGDDTVRAIVLSGAGDSFCAGADISWMKRMAAFSRAENLADARRLQQMLAAVYESAKVTIARINGAAVGGGAGLAAACDVAISTDAAVFAFSEVRLGIAPAVIAPYVLQRTGAGAARAKFVSGERFGAQEALRIGLVDEVVPTTELDAAVSTVTDSILRCGPAAIAATKSLLRQINGKPPAGCAETTVDAIAELRASLEGQEGIRAFLEKRKPDFAG